MSEALLRIDQAAKVLGVTPKTLRKVVARGEITVFRPAQKKILIPADALEEYVQRRTLRAAA